MKTWQQTTRYFILTLAGIFIFCSQAHIAAQTNSTYVRQSSVRSFLETPLFTNLLSARVLVSNILETPSPAQSIPALNSIGGQRQAGTYWSLQKSNQPPWPTRIFPDLPTYEVMTNHYIVDDRSVDYFALHALMASQQETNPPPTFQGMALVDYGSTTNLWLEIPTNGVASNVVNVILHNTSEGLLYSLLTKVDLSWPYWTGEQIVTGAVGNATSATLFQNDRTNLFIWAHTATASSISILSQPISQGAVVGDTVTFSVTASGNGALTYQWQHAGTNIPGATTRSLTINEVWQPNHGDYAVLISDQSETLMSQVAALTLYSGSRGVYHMLIFGNRQDYTFKEGVTYEVFEPVNLYGTTTIKGGSVFKLDWLSTNSSVRIRGNLACETTPYYPAVFTSVDDDSIGEYLEYSFYDGPPQYYPGTHSYLDLTDAKNFNLHDLQIKFAASGILTPKVGGLEVWNSQFVNCDASITNYAGGNIKLHNVLFSHCGYAVSAGTNHFSITAEHVTSDALTFWDGAFEPDYICVTNSLHSGEFLGAVNLFLQNVVFYPTSGNFKTNGAANYYLSATSQLHHAGSTNISPQLLADFKNKTTYAPIKIPKSTVISGELTLFPHVPRYTNGAPDLGYHYDVLDYTIANMILSGGTLNVMPGTVVGLQSEYSTNFNAWSRIGFDVSANSTVKCLGQPNAPVIITDAQFVQEQTAHFCEASFVLDHWPFGEPQPPPSLDFRFSHFYTSPGQHQVWGGIDDFNRDIISLSSLVNWRMENCNLHGGRVDLGTPDNGFFFKMPLNFYYGAGSVKWVNNVFDEVNLEVNPTFYWLSEVVNCDMTFEARNNLFKGAKWFLIAPIPATGGTWTIRDNHFDDVQFMQALNAPLDYDNNAYWPLLSSGQTWLYYTNQLQSGSDTNVASGQHEVVAFSKPPYQAGPFGKYYLPMGNPLYHLGSRSFEEAGLAQYTTRPDQFTEGQELAGHAVNIGLHYVAAQSNQLSTINHPLPRDTDGDGVPDYVEDRNGNNAVDADETSRTLAQTVSGINDATNAVYDDIDLSGNGLVGRIKRALGLNPLEKNNPLTLKQITTGGEPDIATFEVPVSYDALTNVGTFRLLVDGGSAGDFQECNRNTNGYCLLQWNSTFDAPGFHPCQVEFSLFGNHRSGATPDTTIREGCGLAIFPTNSNPLRFNPIYSEFTSNGATLYAELAQQSADFMINLTTLSGQVIKTITGNTTNGTIDVNWDLTDSGGNTITNDQVLALFNIGNASQFGEPFTLTLGRVNPWEDGNFTIAYAWDNSSEAQNSMRFAIQHGVVNNLLSPFQSGGGGNANPYSSTFNDYSWSGGPGIPGWLSSPSAVPVLKTNLVEQTTRNFYFDGHGSMFSIGNSYNPTNPAAITLMASEVGELLQNRIGKISWCRHPYRFVFLNACNTADAPFWANAFGIKKTITYEQAVKKGYAQAFLGWVEESRAADSDQDWYDLASTYAVFYSAWMNGWALEDCIKAASSSSPPPPFDNQTLHFPLGKPFPSFQYGWPYYLKPFRLKIYGYAGITRTGFLPGYDNSPYYK